MTTSSVQLGINGFGFFGTRPATELSRILEIISLAGIDEVEIMENIYNKYPSTSSLFKTVGVRVGAFHTFVDEIDPISKLLEACQEFGAHRMILSSQHSTNANHYVSAARTANNLAAQADAEGIRVSYHSHDHEWITLPHDGRRPIDIVHSVLDHPDYAWDVGWLRAAGQNVEAVLSEFSSSDYIHCRGINWRQGDVGLAAELRSLYQHISHPSTFVVEEDAEEPDPLLVLRTFRSALAQVNAN